MGMYKYPRSKLFPTVQYSAKRDGNKQLSAHFKVKEFQSHDWTDEIIICPYLIEGLEKLFSYMNAKAINITSGYRSIKHSLAVGGSGAKDNHHLGMAADIKVKKQDGTYYSAKQVACALQEIGWNYGIGLMSTSVHVDTLSKYWFDETKRQNGAFVCVADWHTYTGIAAPTLRVRVKDDNLNIRKGPGTKYKVVGKITNHGIYTIVETRGEVGKAGSWGLLKSYSTKKDGWISLNKIYVDLGV